MRKEKGAKAPKPRNTDRHKPGYMASYMKAYRAKKKADAQPYKAGRVIYVDSTATTG